MKAEFDLLHAGIVEGTRLPIGLSNEPQQEVPDSQIVGLIIRI